MYTIICLQCGAKGQSPEPLPLCVACGAGGVKSIPGVEDLQAKGMPAIGGATLKPKAKKSPHPGATANIEAKVNHYKIKAVTIPPAGTTAKTQKAKGIQVLQASGHLPKAYAQVATTELEAVEAATSVGLPCFVRPCPITPRHGFVDSRVVQTGAEVRQVWKEARDADPDAELIVMPFIKATHNMVWRPGLLSVGPGHDGATAGHQSVSIFLQPEYSKHWRQLAVQAGCNVATSDPFVEAVASPTAEQVITQIRAGVKGTVTEPDWNPYDGMEIGEVITIDPGHKADPGAMLAWETTAKTLIPTHHVVWNPGGNLGDHWSVHAQLAGISVVTTFQPVAGQPLGKLGIDLVPLEPQAVIFGYLGGLLSPSLQLPVNRKRAVCAALLGSHHGMRFGGDSGVFLGASVAMMLRLAQAAIWGEARHKHNPGKLSRNQVYDQILDNWIVGRTQLQAKGDLFFTKAWAGGYGGPAWGACSQATAELDSVMLKLVKSPSKAGAEAVLSCLTNVVNLAHNNGWWLNKFCGSEWFDMAADLDPRVAIMAGPIWYDAMLTPVANRMELLGKLEKMTPVDFLKHGPIHGIKTAVPHPGGKPGGIGMKAPFVPPDPKTQATKIAALPAVQAGGTVVLPLPALSGQCKVLSPTTMHVQVKVNPHGGYVTFPLVFGAGIPATVMGGCAQGHQVPSLAGTSALYAQLQVVAGQLLAYGTLLAYLKAEGGE